MTLCRLLNHAVPAGLLALALAVGALGTGCLARSGLGQDTLTKDNVHRIVFLGDSITYGGQYIDYVEACLATRMPDRKFEVINVGLPSETVSGLSEPGHAGGQFPRPCLHERLSRVLEKTKPDLVVACYGMNDGIYYPLGEERFKAYRDGIQKLIAAAKAAGAKILLLTPPTFDPTPLKGKTLPAGLDEYRQPYEGYDDVLAAYSKWLLGQAINGWAVGDIHGPMSKVLAERRKADPAFRFAGDGVHANATGHMIMADRVLRAWGMPGEVDNAIIDAAAMKVQWGKVADLAAVSGGLVFTWTTRRSMPADPGWDAESVKLEGFADRFNRHRLIVAGLPAARYQLYEGQALLGAFSREELGKGIDMTQFAGLATGRDGAELLKLVRKRGRILTDAYLNDIGHKRPGMAKGLPMEEAKKQAVELDIQVRQLAAPVTLHMRLAPAQ